MPMPKESEWMLFRHTLCSETSPIEMLKLHSFNHMHESETNYSDIIEIFASVFAIRSNADILEVYSILYPLINS